MRMPRELDAVEIRVLGCLLEKEQTTPDAYPLSVNALVGACNQKSNRDPVMRLSAGDVEATLDRLHAEVMVWPVEGARTRKWRHSLDRKWELTPEKRAVLTVLLLRGAQTSGEIRARTERMHSFGDKGQVQEVLDGLATRGVPLVIRLPHLPGHKEARYAQLLSGTPEAEAAAVQQDRQPIQISATEDARHIAELQETVASLEARITALETELAGFRRQFE